MENDLERFLPAGGFSLPGTLSDEEQAALQARLWRLLTKRTERYAAGDSTSMPMETAQELLLSICFTLEAHLKATGATQKLLVTEDLNALFEGGLKAIEAQTVKSKRLWQAACLSAPELENTAYQDTLRSIGGFWRRYDYYFFAHQIPCDIDYPLCQPVPESCGGAEYLSEYLRRILIENGILRLFERELVVRLLQLCYPDYKGMLINLCEPVIINAVGLALIGGAPLSLQISAADCARLAGLFGSLTKAKTYAALTDAARHFCRAANITDPFAREYVTRTVTDAYPLIAAALPAGNLSRVFLSLD